MKKNSTIFLQIAVVLLGVGALAAMIRFPLTEGRAVNLDLISIYRDPFILYGYLASISFFIGLYQVFKLLGYIRQNKIFSPTAITSLRVIRYCAIIQSVLVILAAVYIRIFHASGDDPAGFVAIAIAATFISIVIATSTSVFEGILQRAEKDLTV